MTIQEQWDEARAKFDASVAAHWAPGGDGHKRSATHSPWRFWASTAGVPEYRPE